MIEHYDFGKMVFDGQEYTSDLIILPDKIKSSWWRQEGHKLSLRDIEQVLAEEIEALVIGTGFFGLMKVKDEVRKELLAKNIEIYVEKTKKAVEMFNRLASLKKTAGAFHLTC